MYLSTMQSYECRGRNGKGDAVGDKDRALKACQRAQGGVELD